MFKHFIRLFVPHHSNNHKPRVLHIGALLSLVSLLVVAQGTLLILRVKYPQILGFASNIPPQSVITLTNQKRAEAGLSPLIMDERLNDAARRKAADMLNNNYWAHVSPSGTKPWAFILAAGYNYLHAGENLARDFTNPESAVNAWMASATHKDNILNTKYTNIGIAVVDGQINGSETTLIVQMFGTQQSFNPQVNSSQTSLNVKKATAFESPESPEPAMEIATIPEALPTPAPVVANETYPALDVLWVSKAISISFAILVITVLAIDWLYVWRKNIIRLSGKSWAHLTYLAFILLLTIIIKQGLIL